MVLDIMVLVALSSIECLDEPAQMRRLARARGGTGGPDPPENHKNVGFLSNTGPDPLKNHKALKSAFVVGAIIGTPAKRHLNGVSLAGQ